jgi:hypothetical protein
MHPGMRFYYAHEVREVRVDDEGRWRSVWFGQSEHHHRSRVYVDEHGIGHQLLWSDEYDCLYYEDES